MSDDHDELTGRLRGALPDEVPAATRRRHLTAVGDALERARPRRFAWRQRVAAAAAAATALGGPAGVAVAAEGAAPGDVLYPVKRATETVRAVVDGDVAAEHRVEELAVLLTREAPPDRLVPAVEDAGDAVADEPADAPLHRRFRELAREAQRRVAPIAIIGVGGLDGAAPTVPGDGPDLGPAPASPVPDGSGGAGGPTAGGLASPTATAEPSPTRSSPPPSGTTRGSEAQRQRHRARDAGVVVLAVSRRGVRLHDVEPEPGWRWRADRSDEPDSVMVGFFDGERQILLMARARDDGGVDVHVEERSRRGEHTREERDTSDGTGGADDAEDTDDGDDGLVSRPDG